MLCQVCKSEIIENAEDSDKEVIVICTSCGTRINPQAAYTAPEVLLADQAMFHFNCLYNAVSNGITQLGVPLKTAKFLDVGGTLKECYLQASAKLPAIFPYFPEASAMDLPKDKYDFIYLSSMLFQVERPRDYLGILRTSLNPKGKIQIFMPEKLSAEVTRNYFSMPALYQMLQMSGFVLISRMFITTAEGILVTCE